jgi:hypothetical protein
MFLSSDNNYATQQNAVMPKSYIDTVSTGPRPAGEVSAISTTGNSGQTQNTIYPVPINTDLSANFMIDGIDISGGNAVLLNDQDPSGGASVNNGVYYFINTSGNTYQFQRDSSQNVLPVGSDARNAFVAVLKGDLYSRSGWIQTSADTSANIVGTDPLYFSEFFSLNFKTGQGLYITDVGSISYLNVDPSLNFINFLDSTPGVTNATGTLAIGTDTSNVIIGPTGGNPIQIQSQIQSQIGITGPTGSFTDIITSNLIRAEGKGITGSTGSFTYLSSTSGITGPTGSFTDIITSNLITAQGKGITGSTGSFTYLSSTSGITGPTGSFTDIITSNLITAQGKGITGTTGSFTYISSTSGITGPTGSFTNIITSNLITAQGKGITGTTGSFTYISSTSGITGPTGSFTDIITSNLITAQGKGITGTTGSFTYLSSTSGITGPTGSFTNLITSNLITAQGKGITGTTGSFTYLSSTSGITGPTGSFTNIITSNLITAQGKGITGTTGSFTYLSSTSGITGPTGSFTNIITSNLITAQGKGITGTTGSFTYISSTSGITGPTGSFTNIIASNLITAQGKGITGTTGSFTYISSTSGISGPTGSFTDLITSNQIKAQGGITGTTGSFQDLIAKNIIFGVTGSTIQVNAEIKAVGGITGSTGSFTYLTSSNNTYLSTTSGNVGIGTTSPGYKLDVSGEGGFRGSYIDFLNSNGVVRITNNSSYNYIQSGSTNGGTVESSKPLLIQKYFSNGTPTMYLDISNNRVGINRVGTSPYRLDVNGDFRVQGSSAGEFSVEDDTSKFNYGGFSPNKGLKIFWAYPNTSTGRTTFLNNGQGGVGGFDFYQCYATNQTPFQATVTCGILGIGTISPTYKLDVSGNTRFGTYRGSYTNISSNTQLLIGGNATGTYASDDGQLIITGSSNSNLRLGFMIDTTNSVAKIQAGTSGVNVLPLCLNPAGGTVGIGTASPSSSYTLDVNGSVRATSYDTTSDYRIKENVQILDKSYNVDNLKPVTYLNKKVDKQDIGLIAHELQEVFPCLVTGEKDGLDMQSVNYTGLIPILIKEIQDLKKEVKMLKEKVL